VACATLALCLPLSEAAGQPPPNTASEAPEAIQPPVENGPPTNVYEELVAASVRLPLAALLGSVLALRPRRRGTPVRQMSVVETQIILAVVGALVMLVVGASLARAFGIVGAANLIRYRAKVDDPKDAVVMLSALGVGLASGVGLYVLAGLGTLFIGAALWIIEGFEPAVHKSFELSVELEDGVGDVRAKIEGILRRFHVAYEVRASSADKLSYAVKAPADLRVDRVSDAITGLAASGKIAVEWKQSSAKKKES
jgi:hypothetical protein